MNIENNIHASHRSPSGPSSTGRSSSGLSSFDPALHAAAVAAVPPGLPDGAPAMAAGWWESVVRPEDPRILELRHIPDLPAADAARIGELFAEVVDAGGLGRPAARAAWEVLTLWELGCSASAAAASEAATILSCREAEAWERAGATAGLPVGFDERAEAYRQALLDRLGH